MSSKFALCCVRKRCGSRKCKAVAVAGAESQISCQWNFMEFHNRCISKCVNLKSIESLDTSATASCNRYVIRRLFVFDWGSVTRFSIYIIVFVVFCAGWYSHEGVETSVDNHGCGASDRRQQDEAASLWACFGYDIWSVEIIHDVQFCRYLHAFDHGLVRPREQRAVTQHDLQLVRGEARVTDIATNASHCGTVADNAGPSLPFDGRDYFDRSSGSARSFHWIASHGWSRISSKIALGKRRSPCFKWSKLFGRFCGIGFDAVGSSRSRFRTRS